MVLGLVLFVVAVGLHIAFKPGSHTTGITHSSMATSSLTLTVPAFADGEAIPSEYTCDGAGKAPVVEWSGVPEGSKSLALIMEDPDVPRQVLASGLFVHWVLFGIEPSATSISEGGSVGSSGLNGAGKEGYAPPCPPAQFEPAEHRYIFTLYALDTTLEFPKPPDRDALLAAMEGHIIASSTYTGRYRRE